LLLNNAVIPAILINFLLGSETKSPKINRHTPACPEYPDIGKPSGLPRIKRAGVNPIKPVPVQTGIRNDARMKLFLIIEDFGIKPT
jgi:hypothetical protein